ncbi:MAG: HAD-IA family hydrolase [Verrucomicrobia bacterium]|nr:HAD-IA family hydrolase [Verrucomicrobiota bacterium]
MLQATPQPPQGLIFDFDGTLADTMPLHYRAWQVLMKRHGFHFSEERLYAMGGIPSRDILRTLRDEQGLSFDPLAVAREKEEAYLDLLQEVEPIHEIVGIARENHGRLPMAVATGGTRRVIATVLEHLKIGHLFNAVVTSEDVVRQKPAPDIFLEAARRIGVPPQCCRAYEDTDLGLQAIRAAGMEAVDVRAWLAAARPAGT